MEYNIFICMVKICIYKITNPKNRTYIGKTFNIIRRKSQYKNLFCKEQPKIYRSLKKYGWDNHKFEIIEECSKEMLTEREIFYKQKFINEFGWKMALFCNILDEGGGPLSKETKIKISKSKKGHNCFNNDWKIKIKNSLNKNDHSKYYTKEIKDKISKGNKGKIKLFTKEHIKNISKANLESKGKIVECFDLYNNFIESFPCLREAKNFLLEKNPLISKNVDKQIKDCCNGRQKTCHGFKFKYR